MELPKEIRLRLLKLKKIIRERFTSSNWEELGLGFHGVSMEAQTWVDFRQEDLMANWALAEQGLRVHDIKPLD